MSILSKLNFDASAEQLTISGGYPHAKVALAGDTVTVELGHGWIATVKQGQPGETRPGPRGRWLNGCVSPYGHRFAQVTLVGETGSPPMEWRETVYRCGHCGDPQPSSLMSNLVEGYAAINSAMEEEESIELERLHWLKHHLATEHNVVIPSYEGLDDMHNELHENDHL